MKYYLLIILKGNNRQFEEVGNERRKVSGKVEWNIINVLIVIGKDCRFKSL